MGPIRISKIQHSALCTLTFVHLARPNTRWTQLPQLEPLVLSIFVLPQYLGCQQLDVKASATGGTGGAAGGSAAESGGDSPVDDGPGRQADTSVF